MNLYQIDQAILELIDPETGEILDFEAFEQLQMERDQKIENIALWVKNLTAEAKALKDEEQNFAARRKAAENKAESLKKYLDTILQGNPVKTTKFAVTYRRTESCVIDDVYKIPEEYLRYKEPEADKTALKKALKEGQAISGVHLEEKNSLSVK